MHEQSVGTIATLLVYHTSSVKLKVGDYGALEMISVRTSVFEIRIVAGDLQQRRDLQAKERGAPMQIVDRDETAGQS